MFDLLSLLTLEQNMISWRLISPRGTLVEKHWEISFISMLSRLPAAKQQQAFSPKPLVMRVHPPSQGLPVWRIDWMPLFYFSSAVSRAHKWQKRQCLVVCFQHVLLLHASDVSYRKLCLCLSRTAAALHCWDAPKSFIYESCEIVRSTTILSLQIF